MSDWIAINRLRVWTHIGVPDEERAHPQSLEVTVRFKADGVPAAAYADDLSKTVNYYAVAQRVKAIAAERPRKLIETLAEELAELLIIEFHVSPIEVEIRKFILPDAESVQIAIKRKRKKAKVRKAEVPTVIPPL
jgi:dihydroneopterin aldolase